MFYKCSSIILATLLCTPASAAIIQVGDPTTDLGQISVSGWLRANIQDKDFTDQNEHKLKFDGAKLNINYEAKNFIGNLQYRCYQFDTACDFSSLVDAYLGYKFNENNRLLLGVQPIPFGPDVGWSSNWWGGILITAGLEDIHNTGVTFSSRLPTNTQIDAGHFPRDSGNWVGKSRDSSRYSPSFVKPDQADEPYVKETDMWMLRVSQNIPLSAPDLKLNLGGSYWYSDIDHQSLPTHGHRQSWAAFAKASYGNANLTVTVGENDIDLSAPNAPDYATVGSFDMAYRVANQADFYTVDLNYVIKDIGKGWSLTPYATYSAYQKSASGDKDSIRYVLGAQATRQSLGVALEYIAGKNDPFIDGHVDSLAQGTTNEYNALTNLMFFYYF